MRLGNDVTVKRNGTSIVTYLGVGTFLIGIFLFLVPYSALADEATGSAVSPDVSSGPPQTHEVRMIRDAFKFIPALLKVHPGDKVVWINDSDIVHFLASIPGAGTNDKEMLSPMMKPGDQWTHTFEKVGDYPYMCFIHNQMMGAVIVEAAAAPEPAPSNGN